MGLIMAWASSCLLMALKVGQEENAAFAFWSALPFVAFVGYYLVHIRAAALDKVVEFSSPFIAEMKVRLLLQEEGEGPEVIAKIDKLYEAAMTQLSASSMIHIYFALYLQKYKKNRPLEMAQLAAAERKV